MSYYSPTTIVDGGTITYYSNGYFNVGGAILVASLQGIGPLQGRNYNLPYLTRNIIMDPNYLTKEYINKTMPYSLTLKDSANNIMSSDISYNFYSGYYKLNMLISDGTFTDNPIFTKNERFVISKPSVIQDSNGDFFMAIFDENTYNIVIFKFTLSDGKTEVYNIISNNSNLPNEFQQNQTPGTVTSNSGYSYISDAPYYNLNLAIDSSKNLYLSVPGFIFIISNTSYSYFTFKDLIENSGSYYLNSIGGGSIAFDSNDNLYMTNNNSYTYSYVDQEDSTSNPIRKFTLDLSKNEIRQDTIFSPAISYSLTESIHIKKDKIYFISGLSSSSKITSINLYGRSIVPEFATTSIIPTNLTKFSIDSTENISYFDGNTINFIVNARDSTNLRITNYTETYPVLDSLYNDDSIINLTYSGYYQIRIIVVPRFNVTFNNIKTYILGNDQNLNIYDNLSDDKITPVNEITINVTIQTICFKEGTKILCLIEKKEKYIPIEDIKENTFVKVYKRGGRHEFKKATCVMKSALQNSEKKTVHKLYKLAKDKNPRLIEDLYVTGGHAILYDRLTDTQLEKMEDLIEGYNNFEVHFENEGELEEADAERLEAMKENLKERNKYKLMIEDKYKLIAYFDETFQEVNQKRIYYIYHIVLENTDKFDNYAIYANGILAESTREVNAESLSGYERRHLTENKPTLKIKEKREDINDKIQRYLLEKEKDKDRKKQIESVIEQVFQKAEDTLIQKIQREKNRTIKRKQQQLKNKTYRH